jgi:hypothetical protein
MIIKYDTGVEEQYICPCTNCYMGKIETFYSFRHAMDSGWRITNNIKYCPPDKKYVWVCPQCYEGD